MVMIIKLDGFDRDRWERSRVALAGLDPDANWSKAELMHVNAALQVVGQGITVIEAVLRNRKPEQEGGL